MTTAHVGQSRDMIDAWERVTGRTNFALNMELPNMAVAKLLRSDRPHARIRAIDVAEAEQLPGVVAILTAQDFDGAGAPELHYGTVLMDQPAVARDKVRFVGDPIAAVAAESDEAAAAALRAIDVEYEELPAVYTVDAALAEDASLVHEEAPPAAPGYSDITFLERGGNVCNKFQLRHGDVQEGFAQAEVLVEGVYESPAVQHVAMEPHVVLAQFDQSRLTVISPTQAPYAVRDALADMFHLSTAAVRVTVPPLGGSYGAKGYTKFEPVTAALAWKARRPVKLVLSREEEFVSLTKHAARVHMRTGAMRTGEIVACEITAYFNAGAYADMSPRVIKNGGYACVGPYAIPNVKLDSYAVYTNLPPAGPFRGYGVSQAAWAHEQHMDELANALSMDAVELRHRNLLKTGSTFATGETMHEAYWDELLRSSAKAIRWSEGPRRWRSNDRARGKGVAVVLKSTITPSSSKATVRLDMNGSAHVLTAAVDMGQGAPTVLAQRAADVLGLPLSEVSVPSADTDFSPYDQSSSSSRTTKAVGGAVVAAATEVRTKLLHLASELLEAAPGDLVLEDGSVHVNGNSVAALSIRDVLRRTGTPALTADGEVTTTGGLDAHTGQGIASDHWHQGAAAAEVEVDLGTGKVRVCEIYAAVFAGKVINPKLARGQMHGNVCFAISQALYEELAFDEGVLTNPNLSDYAIAALADIPAEVHVELLEDLSSGSVHGLGETALPPALAAIGNATAAALGVRVPVLPLTPERILEALASQQQREDAS